MDKLLRSNWFVVLISFVFALMLYTIVAAPKNMQNADSDTRSQMGQEQWENVEVVTYYDDEKYVVSGVPDTVDVTMHGSPTQLFMAKMERNFEVYVDLNELSVGTHTVEFQYRGLPDGMDATIQPSSVTVTIEERISREFSVEIDYLNEDKLPEGYRASKPIVTPRTVTLYGSERQLDQISVVKGEVDLEGETKSVTKSVPIAVYDKEGNELSGFSLNPNVVDVEIPIVEPHKIVPIKINRENRLPEGQRIGSIKTEPETVIVFGEMAEIENLEFVEISVDLEKLSDEQLITLTVDVPVPEGAEKVEPKQIEIEIELENED